MIAMLVSKMSQLWHFWAIIMLSFHQYLHICSTSSSSSSSSFTVNLFEKWSQEHGKSYSSEQEKQYRIKVLEENYDYIIQHNSKANSSYTLSLNAFADLTHHEFKAKYLLGQPRPSISSSNNLEISSVLQAIANGKPINIGICGSNRAFQFYSEGIFMGPCCDTLDHKVSIVGYDSRNGVEYWNVKNSWGRNWGINGYMQLAIKWNGNSCGIYNNKEIIMNNSSNSKSDCYPFYCPHGETCCCYKRVILHCLVYGCCDPSTPICCKANRSCCPENLPICDGQTHMCYPKYGNATIMAKKSKIRGLSAMLGN